ncbi:hypothetical protein [Micromonospora sicca]|uniref:hypothetical protein n=1 Tax=Micromonospora sicca TaxID=2202420 RepID=UPI0011B5FFD9|nr:hypothetical protein [Micromonospora sp. 4G51]
MTLTQRLRRQVSWLAAAVLVTVAAPATAAHAATTTTIAAPVVTPSFPIYTVGTAVTFTFTPGSTDPIPVRYQYQFDDGRTSSVRATAGVASITWIPARRTTTFTVAAVARDGAVSAHTVDILLADAATPAADQDLNGDGFADLLTVGGTPGLTSGLWLATGREASTRGRVHAPATNIGANGNGMFLTDTPADFDGGQAITGQFNGGGFQDVLVYYPTGLHAGEAVILFGSGDGSVLQPQYSGNAQPISNGVFTDLNGTNPIQVANAYDASGMGSPYDDLIAINGDAGVGYYLAYYPNYGGTGAYPIPVQLDTPTPTGGSDWDSWTMATTLLPSGTAMFLWNESTGQLYLWEGIRFTDNGDMTGAISYTQYQISPSWHQGSPLSTLQATDFDADGVPDLWAVDPAGVVTAYQVANLSTAVPATVRAGQPQHLS